ncbi:MAG: hypothetical protein V4864_09460 [Pseudomonadota bacterium]
MQMLAPQVADLDVRWRQAVLSVGQGPASSADPYELEVSSLRAWSLQSDKRGSLQVLGVAGPGAVGKTSMRARLVQAGCTPVLKSTSRPARPGEVEGKDYFFVPDGAIRDHPENYLYTRFLRGRGWYAVAREIWGQALTTGRPLLIEESPLQLRRILAAGGESGLIVYMMPPAPMGETLVQRYVQRNGGVCDTDSSSTLGTRQVEEFLEARDMFLAQEPIIFLVNDALERVVTVLCDIFRIQRDAI